MLLASLLLLSFSNDLAVLLRFTSMMFLLSLLMLSSLIFIVPFPAVAGFTTDYCVGGPVVAFIPALASGHAIAIMFSVACCMPL
jgi:hypothetical protein